MPLDFGTDIAGGGLLGGIAGFVTSMYNKYRADKRIDKIDETLESHILDVAKNYASKEDIAEIKAMLQAYNNNTQAGFRRLEDKLDNKKDKD